jgi:hypothetical protein
MHTAVVSVGSGRLPQKLEICVLLKVGFSSGSEDYACPQSTHKPEYA